MQKPAAPAAAWPSAVDQARLSDLLSAARHYDPAGLVTTLSSLGEADRARYVNAADEDGWTPLMEAAHNGRVRNVTILLDAGAAGSLGMRNEGGETALMCACFEGHLEVVRALGQHGANPFERAEGGASLLGIAINRDFGNNVELVRCVLELYGRAEGAGDYSEDSGGWKDRFLVEPVGSQSNGLMYSSSLGNLDITRMLLTALGKESVAVVNNTGQNALHAAGSGGHTDVVDYLMSLGVVDVNAPDQHGWTPLHHACGNGHVSTARVLVDKYGADMERKTTLGSFTPLLLAQSRGHSINKFTLGRGTLPDPILPGAEEATSVHAKEGPGGNDINNRDADTGNTMLHKAVLEGDHQAAAELLKGGCRVDAVNFDNETPLVLAVRRRDCVLMEMIESARDGCTRDEVARLTRRVEQLEHALGAR